MNGTVKWFNRDKGFGFISGEDGKDYFVHWKQVPEGVTLNENDAVSFDPTKTERGMQAQNVSLGGGSGKSSAPADDSADEEEDNQDFGEDD